MKALKSYFREVPEKKPAKDSEKGSKGSLPDELSNQRRGGDRALSQGSLASSVLPRPSLFPDGDFRNWEAHQVIEIKCDVMVNWLHGQQVENLWFQGDLGEGVVLKKRRDSYTSCPKVLMDERGGLYDAVRRLNVRVSLEPRPCYRSSAKYMGACS